MLGRRGRAILGGGHRANSLGAVCECGNAHAATSRAQRERVDEALGEALLLGPLQTVDGSGGILQQAVVSGRTQIWLLK